MQILTFLAMVTNWLAGAQTETVELAINGVKNTSSYSHSSQLPPIIADASSSGNYRLTTKTAAPTIMELGISSDNYVRKGSYNKKKQAKGDTVGLPGIVGGSPWNKLPQHTPLNPLTPFTPFTILVEGNTGSGKSTLVHMLERYPNVACVQEPVTRWQNVSNVNLLDKMIHQPERWLTTFQLYSSLTRLEVGLESGMDARVRVLERSLYSERYCFVQYLMDTGMLTDGEFFLLDKWFNMLMDYNLYTNVDLIIYLRTEPEILLDRIKSRGREEEMDAYSLEYLTQIHEYHERWLLMGDFPQPAPVLVLDGNASKEELGKELRKLAHLLLEGMD